MSRVSEYQTLNLRAGGLLPMNDDGGSFERELTIRCNQRQPNHTASKIVYAPSEIAESIKEALTNAGMRDFTDKSIHSSFSLVLKGPANQIVRVRHKDLDFAPRPYCLKPLHSIQVGDYFIEIMPVVDLNTTQEDLLTLVKAAASDGYLFWDARPVNIGKLKDGTPVIIDADAIVSKENMQGTIGTSHYKYIDYYQKQTKAEILSDYKSDAALEVLFRAKSLDMQKWIKAQKAHIRGLGLEEGKLNGVFAAKDIAQLRRTLTGSTERESSITRAILEDRHDRESFEKCAEEAARAAESGEDWQSALKRISRENHHSTSR